MRFIVRTVRETGTITYHCATPSYALQKLQEFKQADYQDIVIKNSKDSILTESALKLLAGREGIKVFQMENAARELTI